MQYPLLIASSLYLWVSTRTWMEWTTWSLVVMGVWFLIRYAVVEKWGPAVVKKWAPAVVEEWGARALERRVWTFEFTFAGKYVERFLAERGLHFRFDEVVNREGKGFLRRLKIECSGTDCRVHRWCVPTEYDWFDDDTYRNEITVWSYAFRESKIGLEPYEPGYYWQLSLRDREDKERKFSPTLTLWLSRGRRHMVHGHYVTSLPAEDILFEVPLDEEVLGNREGDPFRGNAEIYAEDYFSRSSRGERGWACQSGRGEQFEWRWHLCMNRINEHLL